MSVAAPNALRNNTAKLKRVAKVMKTISHPARLAIVELLLEQGALDHVWNSQRQILFRMILMKANWMKAAWDSGSFS